MEETAAETAGPAAVPGLRIAPYSGEVADNTAGMPLAVLLRTLWLTGLAVAALALLGANLRLALLLRRTRRALALPDAPLPVYVTAAVETPCLFGLFRPVIYLTPRAAEDGTVLRHALAHETTHFRHGDHIWALLRCLCLALHWYNPLVWLAAALSRQDGELACDEGALRRLGEAERTAYGHTLIDLTAGRRWTELLHTATTMTGGKKYIRERILRIARRPKMLWTTVAAVVLIAAVAVGCTFTGAESTATTPAAPPSAAPARIDVPAVAGLRIAPATEALLAQYPHPTEIDAATDESGRALLLTAETTLTDFRLFSLTWNGAEQMPEQGAMLYYADVLTPDMPLLVTVSFPGVTSTAGLTCTDGDGAERTFWIVMSGEDGSVGLATFLGLEADAGVETCIVDLLSSDGADTEAALYALLLRLQAQPARTLEAIGARYEGIADWLCGSVAAGLKDTGWDAEAALSAQNLSTAGQWALDRIVWHLSADAPAPLSWRRVYQAFWDEASPALGERETIVAVGLFDLKGSGVPQMAIWYESSADGELFYTDGTQVYHDVGAIYVGLPPDQPGKVLLAPDGGISAGTLSAFLNAWRPDAP